MRRALLFPARQTKWCAFKGFARFYPASTLRKVLRKELMASTFVRRKTDGSRYLIPRLAWLFPGPCPTIEMGGILFRTLGRGIWPRMAWDGPLSGLAGATPVIYSWLLSSAPLLCSSAMLTGWLTKYLYAGLYGTARAYSTSGTMALWAFSGPPVTLSIRCQTDAQPKKSRFESSPSFMYDGSFSLICRQIVLRQNSGDIFSRKFV